MKKILQALAMFLFFHSAVGQDIQILHNNNPLSPQDTIKKTIYSNNGYYGSTTPLEIKNTGNTTLEIDVTQTLTSSPGVALIFIGCTAGGSCLPPFVTTTFDHYQLQPGASVVFITPEIQCYDPGCSGIYSVDYTFFDHNGNTLSSTAHIRYELPLSVGINEIKGIPFRIYPNPASEYIQVNLSKRAVMLELIDAIGNTIHTNRDLEQGIHTFNTGELPGGIYYIRVTGKDAVSNQRLILR